jgi:hypothetical protein
MATTYVYPTDVELTEIDPIYMGRAVAGDPLFDLFPITPSDKSRVVWEQRDNYLGLAQVRGINGRPAVVKRPGFNRFSYAPGYYGEYIVIDEDELTERRVPGQFTGAVDISDLVMEAEDLLVVREVNRMRYILWQLLVYGFFAVPDGKGAVLHTDSYTIRPYTATVPWATLATATPMADFAAVQLLRRGYSVSFGADATAFMNQQTYNYLRGNTNTADLFGRRANYGGTFNTLEQWNQLLQGEGLPRIVIYEEGYKDDTDTWQQYLPDNKVVVDGRRTNNAPVGDFAITRNANNADLGARAYAMTVDTIGQSVPRQIQVHRGHNGGPRLRYPSSIVVMSV